MLISSELWKWSQRSWPAIPKTEITASLDSLSSEEAKEEEEEEEEGKSNFIVDWFGSRRSRHGFHNDEQGDQWLEMRDLIGQIQNFRTLHH